MTLLLPQIFLIQARPGMKYEPQTEMMRTRGGHVKIRPRKTRDEQTEAQGAGWAVTLRFASIGIMNVWEVEGEYK